MSRGLYGSFNDEGFEDELGQMGSGEFDVERVELRLKKVGMRAEVAFLDDPPRDDQEAGLVQFWAHGSVFVENQLYEKRVPCTERLKPGSCPICRDLPQWDKKRRDSWAPKLHFASNVYVVAMTMKEGLAYKPVNMGGDSFEDWPEEHRTKVLIGTPATIKKAVEYYGDFGTLLGRTYMYSHVKSKNFSSYELTPRDPIEKDGDLGRRLTAALERRHNLIEFLEERRVSALDKYSEWISGVSGGSPDPDEAFGAPAGIYGASPAGGAPAGGDDLY